MKRGGIIRQPNLLTQIFQKLMQRISEGTYPPGSQLPPENTLAEEFGVSRPTIRRAIDRLADRGLVHRRQGVGTFIGHPPSIRNPLHQFIDFREMLQVQGYKPGLVELSEVLLKPAPDVESSLHLEPDNLVLETHKYFTADEQLVVYCINHIPAWVFQDVMPFEQVTKKGVMEPILEFYEEKCGRKIEYYTCTIRAEIVGNCNVPALSREFQTDTPVLIVDEIGYGADDQPLHHSVEYHPGNRMSFGLVRMMDIPTAALEAGTMQRALEKLNGQLSTGS